MPEIEIIEEIQETIKVQIPKMYKVLLHNDNTTTFGFVIDVLVNIFHRSTDDAIILTKIIHDEGKGVAGAPYTREIAEEKASETIKVARMNGFPLMASFEEID